MAPPETSVESLIAFTEHIFLLLVKRPPFRTGEKLLPEKLNLFHAFKKLALGERMSPNISSINKCHLTLLMYSVNSLVLRV